MSDGTQRRPAAHLTIVQHQPPAPQLAELLRQIADLRRENRTLLGRVSELERDQLTGLYRREVGRALLADLARQHGAAVVMYSDLDGLKPANDLGQDHGDRLLKTYAELLRSVTRGDEVLVRDGGDEFFVGFPPPRNLALEDGLFRRGVAHRLYMAAQAAAGPALRWVATWGVLSAAEASTVDEFTQRLFDEVRRLKREKRENAC